MCHCIRRITEEERCSAVNGIPAAGEGGGGGGGRAQEGVGGECGGNQGRWPSLERGRGGGGEGSQRE